YFVFKLLLSIIIFFYLIFFIIILFFHFVFFIFILFFMLNIFVLFVCFFFWLCTIFILFIIRMSISKLLHQLLKIIPFIVRCFLLNKWLIRMVISETCRSFYLIT